MLKQYYKKGNDQNKSEESLFGKTRHQVVIKHTKQKEIFITGRIDESPT